MNLKHRLGHSSSTSSSANESFGLPVALQAAFSGMPSPSLKKLGKRPALGEIDGLEMRETNSLIQSPPGVPVYQKRVLPSRSRRGGPGIGNCSVDQLIMDTERRARDSRPVIPPSQTFLVTTYSKAVPPPPESSVPDGEAANSYFDKPEVKAAYLAARAIQVPEFAPLPDDAVGGRLRARAEEEGPETSDEAYLTRHRKYETFEKRQRRREKEKLIHERYKLKERIEQLKGMDATAFGVGGEARRKDMLDVAEDLEMRYAVLLPPEPRKNIKKEDKKKGARGLGDDVDEPTEEGDGEALVEASPVTGTRSMKARKLSVRLEEPPQAPPVDTAVRQQPSPPPPPPDMTRMPAVSVALSSESPHHTPGAPPTPSARVMDRVREPAGRFTSVSIISTEPRTRTPSPQPLPVPSMPSAISATDSPIAPPPRKRQRIAHTPEDDIFRESVLLQIAARKAAQPLARQTSRTTLAFGFRVPPEVEEALHFALPDWLIAQEELERIHKSRAQSTTRSPTPHPPGVVANGVIPHQIEARGSEGSTNVEVHEIVDNVKVVEVIKDNSPGPLVVARGEDNGEKGTVLPTSSIRDGTDTVMRVM